MCHRYGFTYEQRLELLFALLDHGPFLPDWFNLPVASGGTMDPFFRQSSIRLADLGGSIIVRGVERGSIVANRYRLERKICSGGMGVVWEARHTGTGGRLALKILRQMDSGRDELGEVSWPRRFRREARATCSLNSPYVVQIFDAATDAQTEVSYIAMELLDGEDLGELLRRLGPLPPELALRIVAQACEGISAAHEVGVLHRDIKPSNLFIENTDSFNHRVKVLDFGIAKVMKQAGAFCSSHDLTQTGSLLGTPSYMSPEQARGLKNVDYRSDVWSLGAVLYAALTGQPPFVVSEGGPGQLILVLCTRDVPPVQDRAPWVESGIAAVVHRALNREPEDRYSSVRMMLDAILALLPDGTHIQRSMVVPLSIEHQVQVAKRWKPDSDCASTLEEPGTALREELTPPLGGALPPTSLSAPRYRKWFLAAGILGMLVGLGSWRMLRSPAAPVVEVVDPPVSALPAASDISALETISAVVRVIPTNSEVWVDDIKVPVEEGGVLIEGRSGQAFQLRVSAQGVVREQTVALTEIGPVPASIQLETAAPTARPKPKPAPKPVPAHTRDGVGIVTTFQ